MQPKSIPKHSLSHPNVTLNEVVAIESGYVLDYEVGKFDLLSRAL